MNKFNLPISKSKDFMLPTDKFFDFQLEFFVLLQTSLSTKIGDLVRLIFDSSPVNDDDNFIELKMFYQA